MTFKHLYGSISLVGRKVCNAVKYSFHSFGDGAKREKRRMVEASSDLRLTSHDSLCFSALIYCLTVGFLCS